MDEADEGALILVWESGDQLELLPEPPHLWVVGAIVGLH